jgi:hypothetical protein
VKACPDRHRANDPCQCAMQAGPDRPDSMPPDGARGTRGRAARQGLLAMPPAPAEPLSRRHRAANRFRIQRIFGSFPVTGLTQRVSIRISCADGLQISDVPVPLHR